LLNFLTLLNDGLFDVVLTAMEELAQFGTNNEERACGHGTGNLQEQESGTWIGVSVGWLLERNRQGKKLGDGKQDEQGTGELTHLLDPLWKLGKAVPD
jgi:hypothetical protein